MSDAVFPDAPAGQSSVSDAGERPADAPSLGAHGVETPKVGSLEAPVDLATVVTVVSWEDRCLLGLERLLTGRRIGRVDLLRFMDGEGRTDAPLAAAQRLCDAAGVPCRVTRLSYLEPERTWSALRDVLSDKSFRGASVLVDVTTMPRETIWSALTFLEDAGSRLWYAYHRPESYGAWLSRDPQRPRLVFQLSGVAQLGRPTVLVVTTGFDLDRTLQLGRTYEPAQSLLAVQSGDQYENVVHNQSLHRRLLDGETSELGRVEHFAIDAYAPDHGRAILEKRLEPYWETSNVVMASLGPKLSAIALYRMQRARPELALAYAPSGEFNLRYSLGIGSTVVHQL